MRPRVAFGGPGPATLLFRQSVAYASRLQQVGLQHRHLSGPSTTSTARKAGKPRTGSPASYKGATSRSSKPKLSPRPPTGATIGRSGPESVGATEFPSKPRSKASPSRPKLKGSAPNFGIDVREKEPVIEQDEDAGVSAFTTVPLPPPTTQVDIQAQLQKVRNSITDMNLAELLQSWDHITNLNAINSVPNEYYADMSQFIAKAMSGRRQMDIAKVFHNRPKVYQTLCSIAVEAAARNHLSGLNELSVLLLRRELPAEVPSLSHRFSTRYRQVRGVPRSNLWAADRRDRLEARVSGAGVTTHVLLNIVAHIKMQTFDGVALAYLSEFVFDAGWRQQSVVATAVTSRGERGNLLKELNYNVEILILTIGVFHPSALWRKLRHFGKSNLSVTTVLRSYQQLVKVSTGRDRLFVPVRQWDLPLEDNTTIRVSQMVWLSYIAFFSSTGNWEQVARSINEDLPLVFGGREQIPSTLLAAIMANLSLHCATSKTMKSRLLRMIDDLWRDVVDLNGETDLRNIGNRITTLQNTDRPAAAKQYYKESVKRCRLAGLPHVAAHLDGAYAVSCAASNDFDELLALLSTRESENSRFEMRAIGAILNTIVNSKFKYDQKMTLVRKLVERQNPKLSFTPFSWGRIVALLLDRGGVDVKKAISIVPAVTVRVDWYWSEVLSGVMGSPWNAPTFAAAIHILEHHLQHDTSASDVTLCVAFQAVCRAIALTSTLDAGMRHDALEHVMSLIPNNRPRVRHTTCVSIVKTSLQRSDAEGVAEALYWWGQTREPKGPEYITIVVGLLEKKLDLLAKEIAVKAPSSCGKKFWTRVTAELGITRPKDKLSDSGSLTLEETLREDAGEETSEGTLQREADEMDRENGSEYDSVEDGL